MSAQLRRWSSVGRTPAKTAIARYGTSSGVRARAAFRRLRACAGVRIAISGLSKWALSIFSTGLLATCPLRTVWLKKVFRYARKVVHPVFWTGS